MEERKASLLALGLGGLAIAGFWMARPTNGPGSVRVLAQINLPHGGVGTDYDAGALFQLARRPGEPDLFDGYSAYRISDRAGQTYPLYPTSEPGFTNTLKLLRGYSATIVSPRLEAISDGKVVASAKIADLPTPDQAGIVGKPNPLLRLVYHDQWLEVRPRQALPKDERWRITALRTQYTPVRDVSAVLPNHMMRHPSSWLRVPYEAESEAVDVSVTRYKLVETSEILTIPGFCLSKRFGGTALTVGEARIIKGRTGVTVRVPKQYRGPYRTSHHADLQVANALLSLDFGVPTERIEDPLPEQFATLEILSPSAESLGLKELRIGSAILRCIRKPNGPSQLGPFVVTARVHVFKPTVIGHFNAVIPVEFEAATGRRFGTIFTRNG